MITRAELYMQELNLFQNLFDLTGNLMSTWEGGNLSAVAALFATREKILKKISRCEAKIQNLSEATADESEMAKLAEVIDEMKGIHQKLVVLDQKIKEKMEAEKDQVYSQMLQVHHGHRTLQGYVPHQTDIPRYCDKRG